MLNSIDKLVHDIEQANNNHNQYDTTNIMKSKQTTVNNIEITVHSDGSITKPFYSRTKRTFGYKDGNGYMLINIGAKMFHMHRIAAQAFPSFLGRLPSRLAT